MSIKSKLLKLLKIKAKLLLITAGGMLGFYIAANAPMWHLQYIESSVGKVVVKVVRDGTATSGGTGFHVKGASGKTYILTNAHVCRVSPDGKEVLVQLPNSNRTVSRRILEVYSKHDLCLIEALEGYTGISVDPNAGPGDSGRAVGHPLLRPMRAAIGELIQEQRIGVMDGYVENKEQEDACKASGGEVVQAFIYLICVKEQTAIETNITIFPGSSGSPVVNFFSQLVGVVFAGDQRTNYGYLVPIRYVVDFLSAY